MTMQELFSAPSTWTQKAYARNRKGQATETCSPDAVSWCVLAGLSKCHAEDYGQYVKKARAIAGYIEKGGVDLASWERRLLIIQWADSPLRTFADIRKLVESLNI